MRFVHRALCLLVAFLSFSAIAAFADPPARIGRLNYVRGSISFRPGDLDEWSPAMINIPLKTGDHLWTDVNSEAEVHVGSTAIRLAPETAFEFLNMDDGTAQIRLTQGAVNIRLRQLRDTEVFEVDTPNSAVSLLRPGWYRIGVDTFGNTTVTDRLGESEVTAQGSAFTVHPQEVATITGIDRPAFDVQAVLPPDSWDDWCSARDRREEQSRSVQYVSREMVGYEDLDDYGVWRPVPEYGVVWVPSRVPAGWAPYRYGHWIWVEPWGWTWVDDMPWGFAPFHYGRWAYTEGAWVWVPGRPAPRPVYAPALVAFVGGNSWHVSLSLGGGGVAWFPLGPREAYAPAYRVSDAYVRNINVTHVNVTNINVTNVTVVNTTYVNRTVPGAVTAVPQQAFVRAQPVAKAAVSVSPQAIAGAPIAGMAAVAPQHESLAVRPTGAAAVVPRPPAQSINRPVVARSTPPPPPVPFASRQSALAASPGTPLDPDREASLRRTLPATAPFVKPASPVSRPNGQPAQSLAPARPEVQPARPPAGAAVPAQPKPPAAQNDRPNTAPKPAPRPAPNAVQPPPAHPQETNAERGRPPAGPRGEVERNPRGEKPKEAEGKTRPKPGEPEKQKNEEKK